MKSGAELVDCIEVHTLPREASENLKWEMWVDKSAHTDMGTRKL